MNRDGLLDVVICSDETELMLKINKNKGRSWMEQYVLDRRPGGSRFACAADLDGDGIDDIVVGNKYHNDLRWWRNDD